MEPQSFCAGRAGWRRELVVAPVCVDLLCRVYSLVLFCCDGGRVWRWVRWSSWTPRKTAMLLYRARGLATRARRYPCVCGPSQHRQCFSLCENEWLLSYRRGARICRLLGLGGGPFQRQGQPRRVTLFPFRLTRRFTQVASTPIRLLCTGWTQPRSPREAPASSHITAREILISFSHPRCVW